MQGKILPKITIDKPSKERILQLIRVFLYTVGFTGIILHLNEYDNMASQAFKERQSAYALFFFLLIMMTMQRVRMINWQSLAVTAVYAPIAYFRIQPFLGSADLLPGTIISQITFWMALMIITDMVVTGRVKKFKEMNFWLLGFMLVMISLIIFYRQGKSWPLVYAYFILFCFIPVDDEEWGRAFGGLLNAGVLSFGLVVLASLKMNPHFYVNAVENEENLDPGSGGRWYGYFLNIGTFGQFIGLQIALSFLSIIRAKDKFGRFGLVYFLSIFWLGAAMFVGWLCGTDNLLFGTVAFFLMAFVFGFKRTKYPALAVRILVAVVLVLLAGFLFVNGVNAAASVGFEPDKVKELLDKTPLRLFPAASNTILRKVTAFHNVSKMHSDFINNPVLMFMNHLGTSRLGIWKEFLARTTFKGTDGAGIMYRSYFAYNAHNQYIQTLYEQGILAGGMNILFYIVAWIANVVGYVKTKKEIFFVPTILLPMMFAMWTGEGSTICFALTFISFFALMAGVMNRVNVKAEEAEAEEEVPAKKEEHTKGGAAAAVVLLSIAAVALIVVLTLKLTTSNRKYLKNGEHYFTYAEKEDAYNLDNGLYSSEDIVNKTIAGKILINDDKVRKVANRASWGDRAFLAFDVDGAEENDKLILEFTAESLNPTPIALEVNYDGRKTLVELDQGKRRYYLPFTGAEGKRPVQLSFDLSEGITESVVIGNICMADYGENAGLAFLKTGEYPAEEFENVKVEASSGMPDATDAVAAGAYVYAINKGELTVYRGSALKEVGKLKGLGDTQAIDISANNKLLMVSSKGSGVYFVDISSPDKPELASTYPVIEYAYGGDFYGNYAFICNRFFGIEIVDVSDAKKPKYVTKVQYPADAEYQDCYVFDGYLFAAARTQKRVDIYDVRNLADVQQVSFVETDGRPLGMAVKDHTLFVSAAGHSSKKSKEGYQSGSGCGLEVYDINNPEYPFLLALEKTDGRTTRYVSGVWDVVIDGNLAYLSVPGAGMYVYDISNPSEPKRLSVVNVSADKSTSLYAENIKDYLVDEDAKEVFLPYNYTEEFHGSILHTAVGSAGVFCVTPEMGLFRAPIDDKAVAAPDKGEAIITGTPEPAEPEVPEGYSAQVLKTDGCIYSLAGIEDRLFVAACGMTGIKVMDKQMHTICSVETGYAVRDVKVVGNLVYAAESEGGFAVYRYENGLLTEVGRLQDGSWNAYFESVQVSKDGSFVIAQNGYTRFRLIDCSDPENPEYIKLSAEEKTGGMYYRNLTTGIVGGKYLGIAGGRGILWFMIDRKDAETGKITLKYVKDVSGASVGEFGGLTPLGDDCLVNTKTGYVIVNPEKGVIGEEVPDGRFMGKCISDGKTVIFSDAHTGVITIADFSDSVNPVVLFTLDTPYVTDVPCLMDGEIYVPLRHDGILKITKDK